MFVQVLYVDATCPFYMSMAHVPVVCPCCVSMPHGPSACPHCRPMLMGGHATFKNVAPQKQNAICKLRAQYTKRNCTFKLFKAHRAATNNAQNAGFHNKVLKQAQDSHLDLQITMH
jgi:hypothetical protein